MTRRLFVDSNVLMLAVGEDHTLREPCRALVLAATNGEVALHASTEAIQEFCFHRLRRTDRSAVVDSVRDINDVLRLHDFDRPVLTRMLDLVETTNVRGRDAVHAATALEHGFTEIVTADRDFDHVPGLTRVDPAAALDR